MIWMGGSSVLIGTWVLTRKGQFPEGRHVEEETDLTPQDEDLVHAHVMRDLILVLLVVAMIILDLPLHGAIHETGTLGVLQSALHANHVPHHLPLHHEKQEKNKSQDKAEALAKTKAPRRPEPTKPCIGTSLCTCNTNLPSLAFCRTG